MSSILDKLEGLASRFEEVSTLITDPAVISDMKRFVKLNKEYHDLEKILSAQQRYKTLLANLAEAKEILENENDEEMRDMAKMEIDQISPKIAPMEEEIKLLLVPADPQDGKNAIVEIRGAQEVTRRLFLQETYLKCILVTVKAKVGKWKLLTQAKERPAVTKK